jgi:hypothetical protein
VGEPLRVAADAGVAGSLAASDATCAPQVPPISISMAATATSLSFQIGISYILFQV